LENTVGKLTIANARIDFFVSLICYKISVIVALCFPERLSKFGEASFIRSSSLSDPLVTVEGLCSSKKRRPKQHRDDQGTAHALFSGDRLARLRAHGRHCSLAPLRPPAKSLLNRWQF
jgi:hypothetical protein